MQLIDANVILRYLLCDHEEMSAKARTVILCGAYTTVEVLAEVVYVLQGVYSASREEVCEWITALLDDVHVENSGALKHALKAFAETKLDFVDCVLLGYHRIMGIEIFTFDKKLNRLLNEE